MPHLSSCYTLLWMDIYIFIIAIAIWGQCTYVFCTTMQSSWSDGSTFETIAFTNFIILLISMVPWWPRMQEKKGQRKIISPHIFCGSFRRGILETAGNFCASFFLYRPSLHLLWTKLSSRRILSDSFGLVILHLFRVRLLWTSWNFPTRSFSNDWNRNSVCLKTRARTSNACCHSACQPPLRAKSVLATPLYES